MNLLYRGAMLTGQERDPFAPPSRVACGAPTLSPRELEALLDDVLRELSLPDQGEDHPSSLERASRLRKDKDPDDPGSEGGSPLPRQ
jgi:hypothetical protein